jgi:hypothetical protein
LPTASPHVSAPTRSRIPADPRAIAPPQHDELHMPMAADKRAPTGPASGSASWAGLAFGAGELGSWGSAWTWRFGEQAEAEAVGRSVTRGTRVARASRRCCNNQQSIRD